MPDDVSTHQRKLPRSSWLVLLASLLTLLAVAAAYILPFYRERQAILAIENLGGYLEKERRSPDWIWKKFSDEWETATVVSLGGEPISDADLSHLSSLLNLEELDLHQTRISDEGMAYLGRLTNLKQLDLHSTSISDAGLEHVSGLRELEELYLFDTPITDAGLVPLRGLKNLKTLYLSQTHISNSGLEHLHSLTNLKTLVLDRVGVSHTDQTELQKHLPMCKIYRF